MSERKRPRMQVESAMKRWLGRRRGGAARALGKYGGARMRNAAVLGLVLVLLCSTISSLFMPRQARAADGKVSLTIGELVNYGGTGTAVMYADGKPAFCAEPSLFAPPAGSYARSELAPPSGDAKLLRAILYYGAGGPEQSKVDWPLFVGYSGQTDQQKVWADTHILTAYAWTGSVEDALHRVEGSWQERRAWFLTNLLGMSEDGQVTNDQATLQQIKRLVDEVPDDFYAYQIETGSSTQVIVSWTYAVDILLTKSSADSATTQGNSAYSYEGAVFEIRRSSDDALVATVTTGADGTARCSVPPNDRYYAVETVAPQGFKLDSSRHEFAVEGTEVTLAVKDEPARLSISLVKADAATGEGAQPGASFEGAEYQLIDATGTAHTASSGQDGTISFDNLPLGTVTVSETKAPQGYKLDTSIHTFHVETDGIHEDISLEPEEKLSELPVAFDIEIVKYLDTGAESSGLQNPGAGIQFQIISNTTEEVVGTITTDEAGRATTADSWFGKGDRVEGVAGALPYDAAGYTIHEVADTVPEGYQATPDWTIPVDAMTDGVVLHYIVDNDSVASHLQIAKVDSRTGATIPLAGFTFQLLDADDQPISQEVWYPNHSELSEFTTDETGTVMLPEALKPGTYHLRETAAPAPYLVPDEPIEVTIEHEADTPLVTVVTVSDSRATGTATITKCAAGNGDPLAGAEFDVVAQEDVAAPDGSIDAVKGQVVDHVVTGEDGTASAVGLPLGSGSASYAFVETQAPEGYALDATPHTFTVSYVDDHTPIVFTQAEAENAPTTITVHKTILGTDEPLEGAVFKIWKAEEDSEDSDLRITTDAAGTATLECLQPGTYCLQEVEAPAGYLVDDEIHTFVVDEQGLIDGKGSYTLDLSDDYTKLDVSKRDITDEHEVEGAQLSILDADGNTIESWTSTNEDHRINALAPGDYTLVEEMTPNAYDQATAVPFTVSDTGEVQRVVMYDEPISVSGDIDKRQEIADPTAPGVEADGQAARARVQASDGGRYDYVLDFRNTSSTWVDEFTVTDTLNMATDGTAALTGLTTPVVTGDYDGLLNVWYQTNTTPAEYVDPSAANATPTDGHENPWLTHESTAERLGDDGRVIDYCGWVLWAEDVDATAPHELAVSDLNLKEGEVITAVRFEFGRVDQGCSTREGLWERDDLKDEHDDVDDATSAVAGDDGTEETRSGAILHMQVTDEYTEDTELENTASLDLYRNGGDLSEDTQLEDHDDDTVVQQPARLVGPLAKTDIASATPAIATTACVAAVGLALIAIWRHGKR